MGTLRKASGVLVAAGAIAGFASHASAQSSPLGSLYLDTNGATPGTTNSTAQQTWNTGTADWTTDPTGSITPGTWIDGYDAILSARDPAGVNDETSAFPLSTAGTKSPYGIYIQDGTPTFLPSTTPPTRTIGADGVTLEASAGGVIFSEANGGDTLLVNANQSWTNNNASGAFTVDCPVRGDGATGTTYTLTLAPNGSANMIFATGAVPSGGTIPTGAEPVGTAIGINDGPNGGLLALAVTSTGTGLVELAGQNTYSGGTTISSGGITLDSTGSIGHTNMTITGGTLTGSGSLTDNITNDIGEVIALSGSGNLNLSGLTLDVLATGTQTQNQYVLATADVGSSHVTGTSFASTSLPSGWSIDYSGTSLHPGDIVLVDSNNPVPEPASLGLLGIAVSSALIRRRRR